MRNSVMTTLRISTLLLVAFPAAAAAAAALFSGCIDLNSAAGNPNAAAAQYAASLWPNIRALQVWIISFKELIFLFATFFHLRGSTMA